MFDLFYLPIRIFVAVPLLALAPAMAFAVCYWRRRKRHGTGGIAILIGAIVWAAYAIYESYMHAWAQTVVAPIRVDLLIITPMLYAVTVVGAVACFSRRETP